MAAIANSPAEPGAAPPIASGLKRACSAGKAAMSVRTAASWPVCSAA
jgi:hypothetical protein